MFQFGLSLIVLSLIITYIYTSHSLQTRLQHDAAFHLDRLKNSLNSILDKHLYLPKVLAENDVLGEFLKAMANDQVHDTDAINVYLARINTIAQTSDIYLMHPDGTTVAASNWDKDYSFIGKNFAFRPYFRQAMQNRLGRYYALGTSSQERGYYFASAVHQQQKIIGVVVVKIAVGDIENHWRHPLIDFMVTDPYGVIFMASRDDWKFHTWKDLSFDTINKLKNSLKYGGGDIPKLDLVLNSKTEDYALMTQGRNDYLVMDEFVDSANWHIYILMNRQGSVSYILWALLKTLLATLLIFALILLLFQRSMEKRHYEQREREMLEQKVEERTKALKLAQEELIQAGKMAALGQLSASINHELNNPLAAIRTYADNAVQFLQQDRQDVAEKNLAKISQLTERMAAITHQLKSFSRKSHGKIEAVNVQHSLDASLSLLQRQIAKGVQVLRTPSSENKRVKADQVWLEQILLNLLKNAIDSTEKQEDRQLIIEISEYDKDLIRISIADNGAGIDEDKLEHVFEPFFTTKKTGKGLGLGLSISYRLAKDMHGRLSVENRSEGGAIFYLILPNAVTEAKL